MPVARLAPGRTSLAVGAVCLTLLVALGVGPASAQADEDYEVLVVGETLGFRHSHIDETTEAIIDLGADHGFTVDVWDPPNDSAGWWGDGSPGQPDLTMASTPFTSADDLGRYATIIFVSPVDNTNNLDPDQPRLLDDAELAAFQGYIRNGGGFVGIHAATDTMHTVPWYSELTGGGARFAGHPRQQQARMRVESPAHPSTDMLAPAWVRFDEWYNYTANPRADVHVLMTLDESTYQGGTMGEDHPIAWCHNFEGGRSWYEGAGHTDESWADPQFLAHVLGGIEWTAGVAEGGGNCVTFAEVRDILTDDSRIGAASRRGITARLDSAEAAAGEGDRDTALRNLGVAHRLAESIRDGAASELVVGKVEDLQDWQQALVDGVSGEQNLTVTVPERDAGEFRWSIQGDGSVDLGETTDEGDYLLATGAIDPISVTDTRTSGPEWSISGQVGDFDDGLGGQHLGWTPEVLDEGAGAVAGPAVPPGMEDGDGLSVPSTLASAEDGHDSGTGLVGADLELRFPADTAPGEYSATLTITALT